MERSTKILASGVRFAAHFFASGSAQFDASACRRRTHDQPYGRSKVLLPSWLKKSTSPLSASGDRWILSFSRSSLATGSSGNVLSTFNIVHVDFPAECQSKHP